MTQNGLASTQVGQKSARDERIFAWWQRSSRCVAMLQCGAPGNEVRGEVTCGVRKSEWGDSGQGVATKRDQGMSVLNVSCRSKDESTHTQDIEQWAQRSTETRHLQEAGGEER
jgi:hypothetical protein